jgi:hypothetical protein
MAVAYGIWLPFDAIKLLALHPTALEPLPHAQDMHWCAASFEIDLLFLPDLLQTRSRKELL